MRNSFFEFKLLENENGESLEKSVCKVLKKAIYCGYFQPGERLLETRIGEMLHVSRTPVREAMKRLETQGLVKIVPQRGATVVKVSPEDIEEMYIIVGVLEGIAASFAADNLSDEEIGEMGKLQSILESEECKKDFERWFNLNNKLHSIFFTASRKPRLVELLNEKLNPLGRYWYLGCTIPGMLDMCLSSHRNMLEAFYKRDAKLAREACEIHLFETGKSLKNHLEKINVI